MQHKRFLELSHSADVQALQRNLIEFGHEFGFERMGAWVAAVYPDKSLSFVMIHNAPKPFAESTTKNDENSKRDPVLQKLNLETLPFVYNQSDYVVGPANRLQPA